MTNPPALRPPPEFAHLPEHRLLHPEGGYVIASWRNDKWYIEGRLRAQTPLSAYNNGWSYICPMVPLDLAAIMIDPENEAQLLRGTRAIAALDGCIGEDAPSDAMCPNAAPCQCRDQARAVLAALAALGRED